MARAARRGNTVLVWILAVVITLVAVVYQRSVGPTRPLRGQVVVNQEEIRYRFPRSFGGTTDHRVYLALPDTTVTAHLVFKRVPTSDPWTDVPMTRDGDRLAGTIPWQPPGGKVGYRIVLRPAGDEESNPLFAKDDGLAALVASAGSQTPSGGALLGLVPPDRSVVVRFRGAVPDFILVPHVILMFLGMIWANRAGLEALRRGSAIRRHSLSALGLIVLGGLVFGPIVQWYSFGKAWTGFPFGIDLTDNKTLIAVLAWTAAVLVRRGIRGWTLGAAVVTLVIFSIPHSILGTELDYSTLDGETSAKLHGEPAATGPEIWVE